MKIKTLGRAFTLTLNMKLDELKRAETVMPDVMKIVDNKGDELFRISTNGTPGFNKFGAVFADADAEGRATLTLIGDAEATKENILGVVGPYIRYIKAIESSISNVMMSIEADLNECFEEEPVVAEQLELNLNEE